MSPVQFVGRIVKSFKGKRLFDILCRLKNFGVGRIVYRNQFYERYPEPSYYVITKVDPDMSDPTQAAIDFKVPSKAYGMKVFRGESLGDQIITRPYKADWRLVHREDEDKFVNKVFQKRPVSVVPEKVRFPPLFEHLMLEEMKRSGQSISKIPMLPIKLLDNTRAVLKPVEDLKL